MIAATNIDVCKGCIAGKYIEDDDLAENHNSITDCKDCAVRTYNPFEGQIFCRVCKTNVDGIGLKIW